MIDVLGIDLGKNLCSLVGLDDAGRVAFSKTIRRNRTMTEVEKLRPRVVAMEACCGAHFFSKPMSELGCEVRLMSPEYVKPYVKAMKNDLRDAEGIAEAATRPTMRFVTPKSMDQLDMQTLHRVRERLVAERTRLINQMRAILFERNITVPQGACRFANDLPGILSDDANGLSSRIRKLLQDLHDERLELEKRIASYNQEFEQASRSDAACARLRTVPGIGALTATAMVAAVGDASAMAKGRDLSAWIGLVPKQKSTGGKSRLGRITKRGNSYLRKMLIHGARSICNHFRDHDTPLANWIRSLKERMPFNKVYVAIANKLARIAWAVLRGNRDFDMKVLAR